MLDNVMKITVDGANYPIAFTLNVMENIQEKYGSMDKWMKLITPKSEEPQIKDIKWSFTEFINEGIDIENEETGENRPFVTMKQVGRIITKAGLSNITSTLMSATISSIKTKEASDTVKNEETTQNQ